MTASPKPIAELKNKIKFVLSDLDDTITTDGHIPSESYSSLWKLKDFDIKTIIVTGRPAGWCEMMARTWPIDGVIGENGAFFFRYTNKNMRRFFASSPELIETNTAKLDIIKNEILKTIPESKISSDQFCRMFDLAVDICEDIPPLTKEQTAKIISIFEKHGAQAKLSSIHVNGWFGTYDKLTTAKFILSNEFGLTEEQIQSSCVYAGDSPNDEPLFSYFENGVGVRNIEPYLPTLKFQPKYITQQPAGKGFQELTEKIIQLGN
tara:strand:+ start:49807 stop:50598 length:792 start_codon:yes stop_codon:yes gene_type:complete